MRICFVHPHLESGGAEWQTVALANELAARGHNVHVVLLKYGGPLLAQLSEPVQAHRLNCSGAKFCTAPFHLASYLKKTKPDVVIAKLWSGIFATGIAHELVRSVRLVIYEDLDPPSYVKVRRWGKFKQLAVAPTYRKADMLIANSPLTADSMVGAYGLKSRPHVIWPALRSLPETGADSRPHIPWRFTSIASLNMMKGVDCVYEVLRRLTVPWTWTVAGEGPLRGSLSQRRDPRITMLGTVMDVAPVLLNSDIVLQFARHESFGLAVAEALAAAVPVVATDLIGPQQILQQLPAEAQRCLALSPVGDLAELTAAVERMCAFYPPHRVRVNGAARLRQVFGAPRLADQWEEVLGSRSASLKVEQG